MASRSQQIEFGTDDRGEVLARMAELAEAHRGWVNVEPALPDDARPPGRAGFLAFLNSLNGRVPDLALGTWLAPTRKGDTEVPASVGVQHPGGQKTLPLLRKLDLVPPPGWRLTSDAARRGLVLQAPPDADLADVLDWLARTTAALTPGATPGRWVARVFRGS